MHFWAAIHTLSVSHLCFLSSSTRSRLLRQHLGLRSCFYTLTLGPQEAHLASCLSLYLGFFLWFLLDIVELGINLLSQRKSLLWLLAPSLGENATVPKTAYPSGKAIKLSLFFQSSSKALISPRPGDSSFSNLYWPTASRFLQLQGLQAEALE